MNDVEHPDERQPHATQRSPLAHARSVAEILQHLAHQAQRLHHLPISAYAIEDDVCVLVIGTAPADTAALARAVGHREPAESSGTLAVPVVVDGAPVAVLASDGRVDVADATARLTFLADVAAAIIGNGRLRASSSDGLSAIQADERFDEKEASPGARRFSIDALVETSLDCVAGLAKATGIELTSIVEPGTPLHLLGDASGVRRVLVNLLSHVVEHTKGAVVELVSRGHHVARERALLVFEVRGTGPSMTRDALDTSFEPRTQGKTARSAPGGAERWLSTSERSVLRMDGSLTARPTLAGGSAVTVSIPFDVDTSSHGDAPPVELVDAKRLDVLIVDDLALNRRGLELQTARWGMTPTVCASPIDALALVDGGRRFDLALLDAAMPEMSGVELAAALRARHAYPMILLGSAKYVDDRRALFSACLDKPIKRQQLADAIEVALCELAPSDRTS